MRKRDDGDHDDAYPPARHVAVAVTAHGRNRHGLSMAATARLLLALALIHCGLPPAVRAVDDVSLLGGGASFPNEVYRAWMATYRARRVRFINVDMRYNVTGSSTGQKMIMGKTGAFVHYAGSDYDLSDIDKKAFPDLKVFPVLAG